MDDPYAIDAEYYDLTQPEDPDEAGLWLSFAGQTPFPVLEVGCGTGRLALELARAGHTVTGVDPSAAMLEKAREKAAAEGLTLELLHGTLPGAGLPADRFGFVLVPADVFLYCADGEEQFALLRECARVMHFSARLALDLPGPALALDPASNGQMLHAWGGSLGSGRLDVFHVRYDELGFQTRELSVFYDVTGPDGAVSRTVSEHHLRYPGRFEIEYLLRLAGLVVNDVYGDYDLGPLTNDSERMIVLARRSEG